MISLETKSFSNRSYITITCHEAKPSSNPPALVGNFANIFPIHLRQFWPPGDMTVRGLGASLNQSRPAQSWLHDSASTRPKWKQRDTSENHNVRKTENLTVAPMVCQQLGPNLIFNVETICHIMAQHGDRLPLRVVLQQLLWFTESEAEAEFWLRQCRRILRAAARDVTNFGSLLANFLSSPTCY